MLMLRLLRGTSTASVFLGIIILLRRRGEWKLLQYGSKFLPSSNNDSFRMEAIGMEALLLALLSYL